MDEEGSFLIPEVEETAVSLFYTTFLGSVLYVFLYVWYTITRNTAMRDFIKVQNNAQKSIKALRKSKVLNDAKRYKLQDNLNKTEILLDNAKKMLEVVYADHILRRSNQAKLENKEFTFERRMIKTWLMPGELKLFDQVSSFMSTVSSLQNEIDLLATIGQKINTSYSNCVDISKSVEMNLHLNTLSRVGKVDTDALDDLTLKLTESASEILNRINEVKDETSDSKKNTQEINRIIKAEPDPVIDFLIATDKNVKSYKQPETPSYTKHKTKTKIKSVPVEADLV